MTLSALRDDALSTRPDGFVLRLSLPWIRSLPIASLRDIAVEIDGEPAGQLVAQIGDRTVTPAALRHERGWWFIQDRVVLRGRRQVSPGPHTVTVTFGLLIPYLQAGPHGPLSLPFATTRTLVTDLTLADTVSRDLA
jgi:hypothetical protein